MLTQYSPRLGDAISADTDVTKTIAARNVGVGLTPRQHVARQLLREEVRALQIRPHQFLEALLGRLEQIGADARGAAGVVDEGVERAVARPHRVGERCARVAARDVGGDVGHAAAERLQLGDDRCDLGRGPDAAEHQIPSLVRERARNAQSDPARAAGDERDGACDGWVAQGSWLMGQTQGSRLEAQARASRSYSEVLSEP